MIRPRLFVAAGAAAFAVAGAIPFATVATATPAPTGVAPASAHSANNVGAKQKSKPKKINKNAMQFSHEVVVDEQRSGFEPDILIDTKDRMYTSVPNGSSEGTSFVWTSTDHGKSFHLVPGSVLQGKPETCVGGGDTELQLDKKNDLFLSDLQNLTNVSNSVTKNGGKSFSTTCAGAVNTPVDRMWYAVQGTLGQPNFAIYEEYDAVESGASSAGVAGNQLVEEVSSNGTTFVPVQNPGFVGNCLGGGFYDCVSDDEGISGNQFVLPNGEVVIGHSAANGDGVDVSYSKPVLKRVAGQIVSASAKWHTIKINGAICPDKSGAKVAGVCGSTQFVNVSHDSAGNIYVAYSSCKTAGGEDGAQIGPYNVYVSVSRNGGKSFGKPVKVSKGGSNAFSWVTAGSKGRVALAWYHANIAKGKAGYTFDDLTKAEFSVQESESINALAKHPKYKVTTVSEHPIKYGPICTLGLDCTVSGGDRSLGDFLEVSHDKRGALALSYVDDSSNTYSTGATGFQENGPPVVVRQIHGPALIKGKGNKSGYIRNAANGPSAVMNRVNDSPHDDFYSANGSLTPAGADLDLRRAGMTRTTHKSTRDLVFHMRVRSLKSLSTSAKLGGTTSVWITRFTTYDPHTLGNGHIYYAGMQSVDGAKPTFFDGDTSTPTESVQLSMDFSSAHQVPGTYNTKTGRITIVSPLKDFPGLTKSHPEMYSVTAFTGTTLASLATTSGTGSTGLTNEINVTDSTQPYDYIVRFKGFHPVRNKSGVFGAVPQILTGLFAGLGLLALLAAFGYATRQRRVRADALAH